MKKSIILIQLFLSITFLAEAQYKLPFKGGATYTCTQGNSTKASHNGFEKYAFDFALPMNTDVVAMRAGVVKQVVTSFNDNNCVYPNCDGCKNDVNRVVIEHSDGTHALYLHLTKNGANVAVNQSVVQGQVIAKSGNSGCSSGAHLHVMLMNACTAVWYCQSISLKFDDVATNNGVPTSVNSYTSGNYGAANPTLNSAISVTPNPIIKGNSVSVSASVKNTGGSTFTGQLSAALHNSNGTFVGDIEVKSGISIAAGASTSYSFSKSSISSVVGNYQIVLKYNIGLGWTNFSSNGSYSNPIAVSITNPPVAPTYDDACGALLVATNGINYGVTNIGATTSSAPIAPTSCSLGTGKDVWVKFVAPTNGTITARTVAGTLTSCSMALYSGTCSNLSGVVCGTVPTMAKIYKTGLVPSLTYYLRIWNASGSTGTFSVNIVNYSALPNNNGDVGSISESEVLAKKLSSNDNDSKAAFEEIAEIRALSDNSNEVVEGNTSLFPNPTTGIITLSFEASKSDKIEVLVSDVQGKSILTKKILVEVDGVNKLEIDLTNQVTGTYFVAITQNGVKNKVHKIKLVK